MDSLNKILITVVLVVVTTSILYRIMGRLNKPIVLGGILAGMILSNLNLSKEYFDLSSCSVLGDFGIMIFMMLMGNRFTFETFTRQRTNLVIIIVSLCFTLCAGFVASIFIFKLNYRTSADLDFSQFAILISLSLATPAFTLVSLFLNQAHLLKLNISQLSLFISFCEDILFWLLLSAILISTQTNEIIKFNETLLIIAYLLGMFLFLKPVVAKVSRNIRTVQSMLVMLFIGVCASSVLADSVDLHQIIGAFIFGTFLPKDNKVLKKVLVTLEKMVTVLLLPIFFAQIGGLAHLAEVTNFTLIGIGLAMSMLALVSKFSGVYLGARILKYSKNEANFIGAILNLRGVFEVVVIKISWEVGLISKDVFIILVIMAITSTWVSTSLALLMKNKIMKLYKTHV